MTLTALTRLQDRASAERLALISRDEARAIYVERIGYDPHEDDPSISTAEIVSTLIEHAAASGEALL